jgi:hypothetical protein
MQAVLSALFTVLGTFATFAVAQLMVSYRVNRMMAVCVFTIGALTGIILILEASTSGQWTPWLLFPIHLTIGIVTGVFELLRRIIPPAIVGYTSAEKLKKMDAAVHSMWEVAGTLGAFVSTPIFARFGYVYALFIIPIFLTVASVLHWFVALSIDTSQWEAQNANKKKKLTIGGFCSLYVKTIVQGYKVITSSRRYIWLVLGWSLPLVMHRYKEAIIFPKHAQKVIKESAITQLFLGSSNFGELCGALLVFFFARNIPSPVPWVRFGAIALNLLWVFPYARFGTTNWEFGGAMLPFIIIVSAGWCSGDVATLAWAQSQLSETKANNDGTIDDQQEKTIDTTNNANGEQQEISAAASEGANTDISTLGAAMAFLFAAHNLVFLGMSVGLGRYADAMIVQDKTTEAFTINSGIVVTLASVLIFAGTYIPRGAAGLNPRTDDPQCDLYDKHILKQRGLEAKIGGKKDEENNGNVVVESI